MISNGINETASSKPKAAVERVALVVVAEAAEDEPLTQCNRTNIQKLQTWVKAEAVEAEARVVQVAGEASVEERPTAC